MAPVTDNSSVKVQGVHLLGSIPVPNASTVFATIPRSLANHLRRCPDGETGNRFNFVAWQDSVFKDSPSVLLPQAMESQLRVEEPSEASHAPENFSISVLSTGYDVAALNSYREFCQAREKGDVPLGIRFQVSLPTPLNIITGWVRGEFRVICEKLYKERLLADLRRIQDEIPSHDLAIQWDAPMEFAMLEDLGGVFTPWFSPVREGLIERFTELSAAVDQDVEMGFHFCYGDKDHVHFVQPKDVGLMVEMIRELKKAAGRQIQWVHMPVPKDRTDSAYFAPLKDLELGSTELYLGLVHAHDEVGTRKRVEAATRYVTKFGVATECGMGRTPPEQLESILHISAAVSEPYM